MTVRRRTPSGERGEEIAGLQIIQFLLSVPLAQPQFYLPYSGFGGLEVACWPLVPKFAGSHPAEAVGFLGRKKKSSARLPSEGK